MRVVIGRGGVRGVCCDDYCAWGVCRVRRVWIGGRGGKREDGFGSAIGSAMGSSMGSAKSSDRLVRSMCRIRMVGIVSMNRRTMKDRTVGHSSLRVGLTRWQDGLTPLNACSRT